MSIRIISGERRGAKLQTPEGQETRPLRGRIRESLFNILRPVMPEACVLDAFAGSGAAGLEALSNGAAWTTFVEPAQAAQRALRANIAKLRYEGRTELLPGHSPRILRNARPPAETYAILLLMPPYHSGLCPRVLGSEELQRLVRPGTLAVCEIHRDEAPEAPEGWTRTSDRLYGVTRLLFLEWTG